MVLSSDTLSIAQIKAIAEQGVTTPTIVPLEYIPVVIGALALGVIVVLKLRKRKGDRSGRPKKG